MENNVAQHPAVAAGRRVDEADAKAATATAEENLEAVAINAVVKAMLIKGNRVVVTGLDVRRKNVLWRLMSDTPAALDAKAALVAEDRTVPHTVMLGRMIDAVEGLNQTAPVEQESGG